MASGRWCGLDDSELGCMVAVLASVRSSSIELMTEAPSAVEAARGVISTAVCYSASCASRLHATYYKAACASLLSGDQTVSTITPNTNEPRVLRRSSCRVYARRFAYRSNMFIQWIHLKRKVPGGSPRGQTPTPQDMSARPPHGSSF